MRSHWWEQIPTDVSWSRLTALCGSFTRWWFAVSIFSLIKSEELCCIPVMYPKPRQWHRYQPVAPSEECPYQTASPLVGSFKPLFCGLCSLKCHCWHVVCVFPLCLNLLNSLWPCRDTKVSVVQASCPAEACAVVWFRCSPCIRRRHPKLHPSQSYWAWILSSVLELIFQS